MILFRSENGSTNGIPDLLSIPRWALFSLEGVRFIEVQIDSCFGFFGFLLPSPILVRCGIDSIFILLTSFNRTTLRAVCMLYRYALYDIGC